MKDMLIFDDPQRDELIENFKTPPILPVKFACLTNPYIIANSTPWTDCFFCADIARKALAHATEKEGEPK